MMDIILASTSPYRQHLLQRLQIPFRSLPPHVDESPLPGEEAPALAERLALAKAKAISAQYPEAVVIGSDQVATIDGVVMGKPGDHRSARTQLRASSGREVCFYTGIALVGKSNGWQWQSVEPFSVQFRELSESIIEHYLRREQPYDCAGSFKCEGLGISLFKGLRGNDPTSLEGLPLITLVDWLYRIGLPVPLPP